MTPDLMALSRSGGSDFQVMLAGAPELACAEIVRSIPERRLVCRGQWGGQQVYAKLFLGDQAARYAKRDARGARALAAHGIATPALLHEGAIAGQTGQVLIYAAVPGSHDLEHAWAAADTSQRTKLAAALVVTVAAHHAAGLIQTDLYLRNFLCAGDVIHTLDGDGIRAHSAPIPWRQALPNLALLLSKFDVEEDHHIPELLQIYAARRGWRTSEDMLSALHERTMATRIAVARQYAQKKVLRNCTDVRVEQKFDRFLAVSRSRQSEALNQLLNDPEGWLNKPACRRLKNGNTCTVGLVETDDRKIVIKRYNIKNLRHGLGRLLRRTRAGVSWSNAHLLRMLDIATATPLALIERRWGPFRREGYFLAEYVEGPDIAEVFADAGLGEGCKREVALQAGRLLHRMYLLGLEHGDFKATNLKIVDGKPLLLDLDSMRLHRRTSWFERRHTRDLRRFLQNWQHEPATLQMMKNAIEAAYGGAPILKMAGI
jgi:tRNA A-37 threonylcarbamoyl transferase component Bud32